MKIRKVLPVLAALLIGATLANAVTVTQAKNRAEIILPIIGQHMRTFQASVQADIQAQFPGYERFMQILITDPLIESGTGITGFAVDVYEAPGGHGWTARVEITADDDTTGEPRYFYRIWDGEQNPVEVRATGAWIETSATGEALP